MAKKLTVDEMTDELFRRKVLSKIPTPGQVQEMAKKEGWGKIIYNEARKIQRRLRKLIDQPETGASTSDLTTEDEQNVGQGPRRGVRSEEQRNFTSSTNNPSSGSFRHTSNHGVG